MHRVKALNLVLRASSRGGTRATWNRLEDLAELVCETGDAALKGMQGSYVHRYVIFPIQRARLAAALALRADPFEHSAELADLTNEQVETELRTEAVRQLVLAALEEIRDEGSRRAAQTRTPGGSRRGTWLIRRLRR